MRNSTPASGLSKSPSFPSAPIVEKALTEGVGDLIAYALTVTPQREQRVAFSPIETDVKQIVVTKGFGPVASLQDLSGKKIFVNPLTTYPANLAKVNDSLRKQGKPPILVESADKNLLDEDLLEMVNAGIIPATVTITDRAKLWSAVLPDITPRPNLVIADEGTLAWAMRKNNPKLKAVVDEFTRSHMAGTSFGNTLMRRYLQNTKWVTDPTTKAQLDAFNQTLSFLRNTHPSMTSTTCSSLPRATRSPCSTSRRDMGERSGSCRSSRQ